MTPVRQSLPPPPVDRREILRYAGVRGEGAESIPLLERALAAAEGSLVYRTVFCHFPISCEEDGTCRLGFTEVKSLSLAEHLAGTSEMVLMAATVGIGIDRLIARYGESAPSMALMLDAVGSERIEALADAFCETLSERYLLRPRFSPGYGDLPLSLQNDIFRALGCDRAIGLFLNESLLMTPSKSVTALIGISPKN